MAALRLSGEARASLTRAVSHEPSKPGDQSDHSRSMKAKSSMDTAYSARGVWKKNTYQLRWSWSKGKNPSAIDACGATAAATSRRHRSGWRAAAP